VAAALLAVTTVVVTVVLRPAVMASRLAASLGLATLAVLALPHVAMLAHLAVTSLPASPLSPSRQVLVVASLLCPMMPASAQRALHAELSAELLTS
jgi:hypothetical protein